MSCQYHPERSAWASCAECGALVCEDCAIRLEGRVVCKPCVDKLYIRKRGVTPPGLPPGFPPGFPPGSYRKSLAGTVLFALLPGAGQMYLGLVKRGVIVMCAFFLTIALTANFGGFLGFCIPILYFASFFDAINLRARMAAGIAVSDDVDGIIAFIRRYRALVFVFALIVAVSVFASFLSSVSNLIANPRRWPVILLLAAAAAFFYRSFLRKPKTPPSEEYNEKYNDGQYK